MGAERPVVEFELVPDVVVNRLGDADSAGLGQTFEPCSDVDAVAKDILSVDDHVAEIDPDPQLEPARGRKRVVDRPGGALHLDGAIERVDDARKIRQQAVTGGADNSAVMRPDQRIDGAAQFAERPMRPGLVLAHQPAETSHIGVQYGGELPLTERSFPRETRWVINQSVHGAYV